MRFLPPEVATTNKARRLYNILLAQREEMIENIRFNLSLKAVTVNRAEQNEVDSYNNLYREYNKLIYPTKDKNLKEEAERMFAPWKPFFSDKELIPIPIKGIDIKIPKKTEVVSKPKNLSKVSSSLLIPKKDS